MLEKFIDKTFKGDSLMWIKKMVSICEAYAAQGYKLSLRQVYYQLVAHHGLPNKETSYKNIGSLLSDARMAGLVDWDMIEDRNRETIENSHWDEPADIIDSCVRSYRNDLWENQPYHVEVMVEKAALEGVLIPVCRRHDLPFTSNRGYSSSSAMYETGQRLKVKINGEGKKVVVLYFGDHDPSGIDMSRDVRDRLRLFTGCGYWQRGEVVCDPDLEDSLEIRRMALNMPQVKQYRPPPNPAKLTDSRCEGYIRKFGPSSWELDALDPEVIAALGDSAVEDYRDDDLWKVAMRKQERGRDVLKDLQRVAAERAEELESDGDDEDDDDQNDTRP
jgi:hypothetical protein